MPIVCLFGPDGSGKSTLARALVERFALKDIQVRRSWMRGTHTLASLLAKLFSRLESFKGSENPYYGISIPRNLRRKWQLLEFMSLLPVLIAKFLLPSMFGRVIIAERYLPDFIVWICLTTRDPNYGNSIAGGFLKALTNRARIKIYVTARPDVLNERRPNVSMSRLMDQLALYEELAGSLHAFRLDTSKRSVEESLEIVLKLFRKVL